MEKLLRLNGWQRIGVIISIFWVIFAFMFIRIDAGNRADRDTNFQSPLYKTCTAAQNSSAHPNYDFCLKQQIEVRKSYYENLWVSTAWFSIIPILVVWSLVYLGIAIIRWIRAGFIKSK